MKFSRTPTLEEIRVLEKALKEEKAKAINQLDKETFFWSDLEKEIFNRT